VIKLGRGSQRVKLEISPDVRQPTETVTADITIAEPLDRVRSAKLQLGYENTYAYRWAGRRDMAVKGDWDPLVGNVAPDAGTERDTTDWVDVLDEELPVDAGTLAAGQHEIALRIPSWAPGSSSIVRWVVRLVIDREGRPDVALEQDCRVLTPPPADPPDVAQLEIIERKTSLVSVDIERSWFRAGEPMHGTVTLTPDSSTVTPADVRVSVMRMRASHPLERTPGLGGELTAAHAQLDKRLELTAGEPTTLPFTIDIPADADPTSEAVHSSISWYVVARVMYKGFSHGMDRARREFVMVTS
jgi:hypothetical protein